jgi:hypothetical protein
MQPFDANDYRGRVIKAIHGRGGAAYSDPFEIYDIPLDEAVTLDDAAVAARIDDVWAFWQRDRDNPRYRGVLLALLRWHSETSAPLRAAATRAELAEKVARDRAARDGARFERLDTTAARLLERFGGLPEDRVEPLRALAAADGIDAAAFDQWLARHPRVPAGTPERTGRQAAPPELLRQVRAELDELGRIDGRTPPTSLFAFLGVPPGSDRATIQAERERAAARNRARRPDRRRALLDELLAKVGILLVDGDPEAYLDALATSVTEVLRPRLTAAVVAEDRLLPRTAAELLAAAEAEGLDPARAVAVVRALARAAGVDDAAVAAPAPPADRAEPARSPAVDAPQAAEPGTGPQPAGGPGPAPEAWAGRPAAAQLAPEAPAPAAAVAPPTPRRPAPTRGRHAAPAGWQDVLTQARSLLEAGTPIAASQRLAHARELAGGVLLPRIRALGDEISAALHRANERWAELEAAIADGRIEQATALAAQLARTGRDVPGPAGADLAAVQADLDDRRTRAAELLVSAATAAPADRAALAIVILALVGDSVPARTLLAAHLVPPENLAASRGSGAVEVTWAPSPLPGVRYRVIRVGADGDRRAVGVTETTRIDDGAVPPAAELPGYEVLAGISGVWSAPAVWPAPGSAPTLAESTGAVPAPEPDDSTRLIARTPADSLDPARDLAVVGGMLRWAWPDGCTEMFVVWRPDAPPIAANDPAARTRKVTNARYDVDGGLALPPDRPLHVAIFGCLRDPAGHLVVASVAAPSARCHLPAHDSA